jgi:hypothetical protein
MVGIVVGCTTISVKNFFEKDIDFFGDMWYNIITEWGERSTPYGRKGE